MGLVVARRAQGILYGPAASPAAGRGADRTTMAVVAEVNDDAGHFLRMVVGGRPLSGSVIQAAENFGAIPLRDGSMHATAKLRARTGTSTQAGTDTSKEGVAAGHGQGQCPRLGVLVPARETGRSTPRNG